MFIYFKVFLKKITLLPVMYNLKYLYIKIEIKYALLKRLS